MYRNTVANSAMLQIYLRHDFYNNFYNQHELYIASGSASRPPN